MKYHIIWHDVEDGRSGESFDVEAASLVDAHHLAVARQQKIVKGFDHINIESIRDAEGNYHRPEDFLHS